MLNWRGAECPLVTGFTHRGTPPLGSRVPLGTRPRCCCSPPGAELHGLPLGFIFFDSCPGRVTGGELVSISCVLAFPYQRQVEAANALGFPGPADRMLSVERALGPRQTPAAGWLWLGCRAGGGGVGGGGERVLRPRRLREVQPSRLLCSWPRRHTFRNVKHLSLLIFVRLAYGMLRWFGEPICQMRECACW